MDAFGKSKSTVSVVLPTYRRPEYLATCLASLMKQSYAPCEVIVGRRENDCESAQVLDAFEKSSSGLIRQAVVPNDGNLVCSLNACLAKTTGEFIALTDDDAEFPTNWLECLIPFFADQAIGGVGGKDIQLSNPGEALKVGKLQWFGRLVGNHHLGVGPIRDVHVLKGVNCCFRGAILREIGFDKRLRGFGNVSNWELGVCFAFSRLGYRLVFDPSIAIVHHVGPRSDGDINNRGGFNGPAHSDAIFNETLLIYEHISSARKIAFIIWALIIGTSNSPGLLQIPRVLLRQGDIRSTVARIKYTLRGRTSAFIKCFRKKAGLCQI